MLPTPTIVIFVRHSAECKWKGDEYSRKCQCRKHFRWTQGGKQHRRSAGTRSWSEAERLKRDLEDVLSGVKPPPQEVRSLSDAINVFIVDKRVQGVSDDVVAKYTRELGRLRSYCDMRRVHTVQGITREIITGFCEGWSLAYPSTTTRSKMRERYRSFLRYCYQAQWIQRIPEWPKIKIEEPPTMPLTDDEYVRLLDSVYVTIKDSEWCARVHALFQLMRWTGLAITDALTLERSELIHDKTKNLYRVETTRTKTKTHVSVAIPPAIAEELLAVPNDNPIFFFWSGKGSPKSITGNWGKRFIAKVFEKAEIPREGYLLSHRLRDTFAVHLLVNGVPMEEVSRALGHTSIRTTEKHYAKWVPGRQNRLDTLIAKTW
jgi:integrase/recombinase XerD